MTNEATPLLPRSDQEASCLICNRGRIYWKRRGLCLLCISLLSLVAFQCLHRKATSITKHSHPHGQSAHILNFLVIGDWGRQGLYNQSEIAFQMGEVGDKLGIDFVVSVGDNFYDRGLTGVNDSAFTTSFTDVYNASSLQTTWYTVLGNHDYMGDVLSQISDDLAQRDPRWFCRRQFQLNFSLCYAHLVESCNASVDMFFFDTTPFVDEYWQNTTQSFDWRGLAPRDQQLKSQLEDLALNLQASNATWKIVFGHHTIRSVGSHGDIAELVEQLLPVLEKYGVDMYINGHDHNVQHIKRADSPIHFFTSGGGSKSYNGLQSYDEDDGVQFARDGQGFLSVSMSQTLVSLIFYDVFGEVLYSHVFQK